jgi:hypothetical protein
MDENLRPDHPPFCAPCAVTVYDHDCLMHENDPYVFWTPNLKPEQALKVLERAAEAVRAHIDKEEPKK